MVVYLGDLNLVRSPKEITKISVSLTKEFKIKDLGKTKFCLRHKIDYFEDDIMLHRSTYTLKVLK